MRESHSKPPLHPPVAHEFGPGLVLKSQFLRPQMRPAFQLSGTKKETEENGDNIEEKETVVISPPGCSEPIILGGDVHEAVGFWALGKRCSFVAA